MSSRRDRLFERYAVSTGRGLLVRCTYCGAHLSRRETTRDHVRPRARGGGGTVPACRPCNGTKGALSARAFAAWLASEAGVRWVALGKHRPVFNLAGERRRSRQASASTRVDASEPMVESRPVDWPRGGRDDYEGEDR